MSKGTTIVKNEYGEQEIAKIRNIGILAHIDAGSFVICFLEITYKNFYFNEFTILTMVFQAKPLPQKECYTILV